jgi:hypothetical protein
MHPHFSALVATGKAQQSSPAATAATSYNKGGVGYVRLKSRLALFRGAERQALRVACPQCQALPGDRCATADFTVHVARCIAARRERFPVASTPSLNKLRIAFAGLVDAGVHVAVHQPGQAPVILHGRSRPRAVTAR